MSVTKLSLAGKNSIISGQGRVWPVTPRLGTGKSLTFFYSVCPIHGRRIGFLKGHVFLNFCWNCFHSHPSIWTEIQTKPMPATHMEESQGEDRKVAIMAVIAELRGIEGGGNSNDSKKPCLLYLFFFPWSCRYSFSN
jgi:hypothetical protein